MRTSRKLSILTAVATAAGCLTFIGGSPATATASSSAQAGQCGSGVFLDGLRAHTTEPGHDEVYITKDDTKIWPTTSEWVSIAAGQRVEIDKCVTLPAFIRIWDVDGVFPAISHQLICGFTIHGESTFDQECRGSSNYRVGILQ